MKRTPVLLDPRRFPARFRPLLDGADLYDSSCSPEARVYYIDRDGGCYLKTAAKGALETEASLTRFFHEKHLAAEVLAYESADQDFLLTRAIPGEDCTHPEYLENPKLLCDTTAALLRRLHETDPSGCPVPDRIQSYLATARRNYQAGRFDSALFSGQWAYPSAREAWAVVEANASALRADTLLHGDYCLPNIMLDHWNFSGFLDLGTGGVGDRHIDLFWGVWTLFFNLKTNAYQDRFLDAYGRDRVEPELLRTVAAFEAFG